MHISNLYLENKVTAFAVPICKIVLLSVCLISFVMNCALAQSKRQDRLSKLVEKVDSLVEHHMSYRLVEDRETFFGNVNQFFIADDIPSESYEVQVIEAEQKKLA